MDEIIKVVVIGAGFAGVNFLMDLSKDKKFDIILVERNSYKFFPSMVYYLVKKIFEKSLFIFPCSNLFGQHKNVHFCLAEIQNVNVHEKKIILSKGELNYDILIFSNS